MRCLSLSVVVLVVACGSQPAPAAAVEVAPVAVVAAPVVTPEAVAEAPAVRPAAPEVALTVAECVEYLASYRGCIAGMGQADARAHTQVVAQMEASWRLAQADAALAGTLAESCSASRAASKLALPGCKQW